MALQGGGPVQGRSRQSKQVVIIQQPPEPDQLASAESFPADPSGLPEATRPTVLELSEGDVLDLRIGAVAKGLGDATLRMLGYYGSIPGPTLKVWQGSELVVHVTNEGDLETTVHWHGLRLENNDPAGNAPAHGHRRALAAPRHAVYPDLNSVIPSLGGRP